MILSLGYHPLVYTLPDPGIVHLLDPRRAIDTVYLLFGPLLNRIGIIDIIIHYNRIDTSWAPGSIRYAHYYLVFLGSTCKVLEQLCKTDIRRRMGAQSKKIQFLAEIVKTANEMEENRWF